MLCHNDNWVAQVILAAEGDGWSIENVLRGGRPDDLRTIAAPKRGMIEALAYMTPVFIPGCNKVVRLSSFFIVVAACIHVVRSALFRGWLSQLNVYYLLYTVDRLQIVCPHRGSLPVLGYIVMIYIIGIQRRPR